MVAGIIRDMKSIVILISGRGSNMQAIVEAVEAHELPVRVAAVLSNRADAAGLEFARGRNIPTAAVSHRDYATREQFDTALAAAIDAHAPDLVVLAGFMRILTPQFVGHYSGRMVNIHPSLLPAFPGTDTHRRALEAGVKKHGCTVHFVTAEVDQGPIILQGEVSVLPGDDETRLAARVLEKEHVIYPRAVRWFAEDRLKIENGKVVFRGHAEPQLV
jgi:phosphoribosylglycinamide formyltransferase-1